VGFAVIYAPKLAETYVLSSGNVFFIREGKFYESFPARLPSIDILDFDATVEQDETIDGIIQFFRKIARSEKLRLRTRSNGSIALGIAETAFGKYDAYISAGHIWDIVAAASIALAKGLKVTNWSGGPWWNYQDTVGKLLPIVVAPPAIHKFLMDASERSFKPDELL